jgi:CBS domain containing-hemolysin-like protein
VTFLHVVVGELAPRRWRRSPGTVALRARVRCVRRVFRPVLWLMNGTGNLLVRSLGVRPAGQAQNVHTAEEISMLVAESRAAGEIRPYAGQILGNVFRLSRTRVRDVMIPRERVVAIDRSIESDTLLDLIKESGFTRIPVYDGHFDNVIGILHTKDLFQVYADRRVVILGCGRRGSTSAPTCRCGCASPFGAGATPRDRARRGPCWACARSRILEQIVGEIGRARRADGRRHRVAPQAGEP